MNKFSTLICRFIFHSNRGGIILVDSQFTFININNQYTIIIYSIKKFEGVENKGDVKI